MNNIFKNAPAATTNVHNLLVEGVKKNCQKSSKIIDLGAGEGRVLNELKNSGFNNLSATDLDDNFRVSGVDFKIANLNLDLNFLPNTFDVVLSSEVIEHLENPWHFIREINKILKKDGIAIITTPNINSLLSRLSFLRKGTFRMFEENHYKEWGHITPLSWSYLELMFKKNEFIILSHQYNTTTDFLGSRMQVIFRKYFILSLVDFLKVNLVEK